MYDTEPNMTKVLQDKDKRKEFQLLVKEMEKKLKDDEFQSKTRNAGNRSAR
jgi:DNA-binding LytR/AlgR family response regulator